LYNPDFMGGEGSNVLGDNRSVWGGENDAANNLFQEALVIF